MDHREIDRGAVRKTVIILVAIAVLEAIPLTLSLSHVTGTRALALYDPLSAGAFANVLALAIAAAFVSYAIWAFPLLGQRFFQASGLKLLSIPFAIITGSMEELWFRRSLMDTVAAGSGGVVGQVEVSALLFGLVHAVWGAFARKWRVALGSMVATAVLGAALAMVYLVGGRNIAPCMWAHIAINLCIEPWLLLAACSGTAERKYAQ